MGKHSHYSWCITKCHLALLSEAISMVVVIIWAIATQNMLGLAFLRVLAVPVCITLWRLQEAQKAMLRYMTQGKEFRMSTREPTPINDPRYEHALRMYLAMACTCLNPFEAEESFDSAKRGDALTLGVRTPYLHTQLRLEMIFWGVQRSLMLTHEFSQDHYIAVERLVWELHRARGCDVLLEHLQQYRTNHPWLRPANVQRGSHEALFLQIIQILGESAMECLIHLLGERRLAHAELPKSEFRCSRRTHATHH